MDVLFIISHKPDNRYKKRWELLSKKYSIGIMYWNKEEPQNFFMNNITLFEINVKANRTNPLKRLSPTLRFISLAYRKVIELSPKCLYVGNLDMLMVAYCYKKRNKNVSIVYEIADLHRLIIDQQKTLIKKAISKFLKTIEKKSMKSIDRLVLTSMKFFDFYYKDFVDKNKVIFLPNMPEEKTFAGFNKYFHDKFTVGFIGRIRYKEQLRMLIRASQNAAVNVIFAGEDEDGNSFEKECQQYSHVKYLGKFIYEKDIQNMYKKVDCVYAVYDADMTNVRIALPNKLYESILCEMPIIVAKNTYLSELVEEMQIGVAVGHQDEADLTKILVKLATDKDYYNNICNNSRLQKATVNLNTYNRHLLEELEKVMG